MRTSTVVFDRVAALLAGATLLVAGAAVVAWPAGWLAELWPATTGRISSAGARSITEATWWPWACAGVGLLAVLAGVRWLAAHLPRRLAGTLLLPGSGRAGRLALAVDAPAGVAAAVFAETPGVRGAHGRTIRDRGTTIVSIAATVEPHADLSDLAEAADAVASDLRTVLERDDIATRFTLTVARRRRSITRVR